MRLIPKGVLLVLVLAVWSTPSAEAASKKKLQPSPEASTTRKRSELPATGAGSVKGRCADHACPKGQECVLVEVHCIAAPCPPLPECVQKK